MSQTPETLLDPSRRRWLQGAGVAVTTVSAAPLMALADPEGAVADTLETLLQTHYRRMSRTEIQEVLHRIERRAEREHGVRIRCQDPPPVTGVRFGFAVNLSKCKGLRHCVTACRQENNVSMQGSGNVRVLAMPPGVRTLESGEVEYDAHTPMPPGSWFLPVQCQQCADPACVRACPVEATWREPDGIVVIDYDWCIGCRYCAAACPYWARRFNWQKPHLSAAHITPETSYLGNRPRPVGVMEKCTWCIQRTRQGRMPACQEACPSGARIFGDLLDPGGELRHILEHKTIFRLKEELHTDPQTWYFTDV
ncbi:MAG: 4Fe-4S dicluster domain-containing protein [Magnetococcales bacterium]|nr:4Fe-4S dicluster domain-containing protein [Magnetococcales bacterium]NGZ04976.1 4Fe-4S dicluster domain-containing protein [Magnetococcales bacterium]